MNIVEPVIPDVLNIIGSFTHNRELDVLQGAI